MGFLIWLTVLFAGLYGLVKFQASFRTWTIIVGAALLVLSLTGLLNITPGLILWAAFLLLMAPLNSPSLRRKYVSNPMLNYTRKVLPPMSDTERAAIEAGTTGWESELFAGDPDWSRLLEMPAPHLTQEEQEFINGPVDALCEMLDDWEITEMYNDLPPHVWEFLKTNKFFGMIIPKEYGGLGFSAQAHSSVVMKVSSRSGTAGVTVMVPNSLGPAELLLHYGAQEQKDYYLPRLAIGEEIPCFALTSPAAGSDAGSIPDFGIICKGEYKGKEVLGFRTTWEKRYITLGPVATLLGLAFKAYDPDHLLGSKEELGITCALVPTNTPGIEIGRRHNPNSAFQNGPNSGKDVFIPFEWLIGGQERIGQGWRMLVESLSAGRGISLPSLSAGAGKMASRMTGAYARVRKQFHLPIGKFEGVEEALARIGGLTYMMDAGRLLSATMIDIGEKPSVVSAILKYHNTEAMRQVINDAMDVHGGRGICLGPSNYLARPYQAIPVSITVEGANILTRSMIIFGQGAMRCHPFLLREVSAASNANSAVAEWEFDAALFEHMGYTVKNKARSILYGLSGARLANSPVEGFGANHYRQLARLSASFAFLSDVTLLLLGGSLKRKERLSARFADVLSYMLLCSAVLKHFKDTGKPHQDRALLDWSAQYCLFNAQQAMDGILRNFPAPVLGSLLRIVIFPLGRWLRQPSDELGHEVASLLLEPSETRDRLTQGIYINFDPADVTGRLEHALKAVLASEPVEKRLHQAGFTPPRFGDDQGWLEDAVIQGVITAEEASRFRSAQAATRAAIMVDDFDPEYKRSKKARKEAA